MFGEPASGTTGWLDYAIEEVLLEPRAARMIDFAVTVPDDTAPGEYITALVAENVEPYVDSEGGGVGLQQVNRTVVAVAIEVPGPREPALEIGPVGHKAAAGSSFVSFEVSNPGNVHLKPSGAFLLRDAGGAELATAPAVMDSVYAGTETLFEAPLAEALVPGDYCAELSLADEETGVTDSTECLPFTVEPPPPDAAAPGGGSTTIPIAQPAIDAVTGNPLVAALVVTALLALLGAVWLLWRRRSRRGPRSGAAWLKARVGIDEPAWPEAEELPARPARVRGPGAATVLQGVLAELPEISRAWMISESAEQVLVVEVGRGIGPPDGSRLARSLQAEMHAGGIELRMRTRFVQGAGPVARATNGAEPFYVRSAALRADTDAMRPQPS